MCSSARRAQRGAFFHDHRGAKSGAAESGHCSPPGAVGSRPGLGQRGALCPHRRAGLLPDGAEHPALRRIRGRSRPLRAGRTGRSTGQNTGMARLRRGFLTDRRRAGGRRLGGRRLRHPHPRPAPVGPPAARPARPRAGALHSFRRRLPPGGHGEGLLRPLSSSLHPGCKGRRRL